MGRFDKILEGEKKLRGVKRNVRLLLSCRVLEADPPLKVEPAEVPAEQEKVANIALIRRMEKEPPKKKVKKDTTDGVLNVRKAIRVTSGGKGSIALAKSSGRDKPTKGKSRR